MENRLLPQRLITCLLAIFFYSLSISLSAQTFTLTYTGEDTLYVGNNCTIPLDWGHPSTINFTESSGGIIDTFFITSISDGFNINDPVSPTRTIYISYFVQDTTGFNQTLDSVLSLVIADTLAPLFVDLSLPPDATYNYLSEIPKPEDVNIVAFDNCIEFTLSFLESPLPSPCVGGTFTRTWIAIDTSNNQSIFTQNITLRQDTTPPTWVTNPISLSIDCDGTFSVNDSINSWLAVDGHGIAIDSSGTIITNDFVGLSGNCGVSGSTSVIFTATDSCGNAATTQATIEVNDSMPPTIIAEANDTTVICSEGNLSIDDWLNVHGNAIAVDSCTTIDNTANSTNWVILNIDTIATSCGDTISYTALFEVRDDCGNADSTMATFTKIDTIGPQFNGLFVNQTELCGGDNDSRRIEQWFDDIDDVVIDDPCTGSPLNFIEINYTGRDGFTGTWRSLALPFPDFVPENDCTWYLDAEIVFEDACGRRGVDTARFSLIDTIPPVFVNIPSDTLIDCGQAIPDSVALGDNGFAVTDNCDADISISFTESRDTSLSTIRIHRTWIAIDDCNNSDSITQTISLIDTIAPVLTNIPSDTTVACDDIPPAPIFLIASDNCTDTLDITFDFDETVNQGISPDSCQTYSFTVTRTWVAIDAFNNSDTFTQVVTVVDTVAPTFVTPANLTVSCELRDSLSITGIPTNLSDNCDPDPDFSFTDLVIGGDCIGGGVLDTIFRTWLVMDACGNVSSDIQTILLVDTTAPTIIGLIRDTTIQCQQAELELPIIGTDIQAIDNCTNSPIIQFIGETNTQGNNLDSCNFYNFTISRTWRATDGCGNTSDFVQQITIIDTIAPVITCPEDMIVSNINGRCEATINLPSPVFLDECTAIMDSDSFSLSQNFSNGAGADLNTIPVDTMTFSFNIGGAFPNKIITSNLILHIELNAVDGEGANESFTIIGEDGLILGTTNPSDVQCGNSSTTINITTVKANEYAIDSLITLTLQPNGVGNEAINNICTNGSATATIEYDFEIPNPSIQLAYAIDGGVRNIFSPETNTLLEVGNHSVTYFATDCSGNIDSCTFTISILDQEGPTLSCPQPIEAFTNATDCEAAVALPFPTNFMDNCDNFSSFDLTLNPSIRFRVDANAGLVPIDINESFSVSNAYAIGDGILQLSFTGDNKDVGEFFNVFSENGAFLGTTLLGDTTTECTIATITTFNLPQDSLNSWGNDGSIEILVTPNTDAASFSDFIQPCSIPLDAQQSDGNSQLLLQLIFPTIQVNYTIQDENQSVFASGLLTSPKDTVVENINIGLNTVIYTIADASGNEATCSYLVEVKDTIAPLITCRNDFVIATSPSGVVTDLSVFADSLITDLQESCGIENIFVLSDEIICNNVGLVEASVSVMDSAGNIAFCETSIEITIETLEPTFSIGACNDDALLLFADTSFMTPTEPSTIFSYSWTGPNNFTFDEANPIILNPGLENSGTYNLTITGPTGCSAQGSIFINITSADVPPISTSSTTVCTDEGITLTTTAVSCNQLEYQWFEVVSQDTSLQDTTILVGTTTIPSFRIESPTPGRHAYFLVINCEDCTSLGSEIITITAFAVPEAITGASVINICAGESITLSSPLTDQTCTYAWVGPGFNSNLSNPSPIENATEEREGVYTLTVSKNGCTSEPAFTIVNITSIPEQPSIANESGNIICEGNSLVLRSNITNANTYIWTNNSTFATFTTTIPELQIDSVSVGEGGEWTVMVEMNNCTSEPSEPIDIVIEQNPIGTPFFEGIACESQNIQLNVNPVLAGLSYEWVDEAGVRFFGANPEVPVQSSYTLTIASVNSCASERTLEIEVQQTPVITTIFDSGDANPCILPNAAELQLIADVFPADDGTYTYNWITPNGTILAPLFDSILTIPNASATNVNGVYTLTVTTGAGCTSTPLTNQVEVIDIPLPNPVINANKTELCEGETLMLTATEYPNISAEYRWQITSIMDTVTQTPILTINNVTTALNGVVTLQVFNDGCPSISEASLNISVSQPIAQPRINPLTDFCEGEVISLSTDGIAGATYFWEGPNFSATSTTPEITISGNAMIENNGGYTVQVLLDGCTSPRSEPLTVIVNEVPPAPIINNSGDVCADNLTDIILFVDEEDTPVDASYRWYNEQTGELIAGPNTFKSQIIEVADLPAGTYQFFATQTIGNCESPASNTTQVNIDAIPNEIAQVCESTFVICDVEDASLCALPPSEGIGTWTTTADGIIINEPNNPTTSITGLRLGSNHTFLWTLSNGACGNYSATTVEVTVGFTQAVAQVCSPLIEVCEDNTLNLCANPVPSGFDGRWSQPNSQVALGVTIDNPTSSNSTISTIEPGNPYNAYLFYWNVTDAQGICSATDTVEVKVFAIPSEIAVIEDEDLIACNEDALIAALPASTNLTGEWSSPNTTITFENPNSFSTIAQDLQPGSNTLIWSLSSGACMNYTSDEITLFYEEAPQTTDDEFSIGFSAVETLNVLDNDLIFSPAFEVNIATQAANGTLEVTAEGAIIYTPRQNFVGADIFTYELCNPTCTNDCAIGTVQLNVGDDAECMIPTIMTPNGDNINDSFFIACLETDKFPRNEVIIFNQWGDEIFRSQSYQNDWRGTYNGEDVPAGTYYYIVSFDRNTEPQAGFLIIER